ncbi:iron ABC transporter substrate-binding protein, partial [Enterococcus hirae]|nr:iron ABC transporter substrate-binding protein [Enterococcus hirae]
MKVLKNLSLMVLLALAFAGCRGKSSQLADFNKQLYAPEYASGFKIERADGRQSVLV